MNGWTWAVLAAAGLVAVVLVLLIRSLPPYPGSQLRLDRQEQAQRRRFRRAMDRTSSRRFL